MFLPEANPDILAIPEILASPIYHHPPNTVKNIKNLNVMTPSILPSSQFEKLAFSIYKFLQRCKFRILQIVMCFFCSNSADSIEVRSTAA